MNTRSYNQNNEENDVFLRISDEESIENYRNNITLRISLSSDYIMPNISRPRLSNGQNNPDFDKIICNPNDFSRNYSDSPFIEGYYSNAYDLSSIMVGDIIVEASGVGHAAIVYDTNKICRWVQNGVIREFHFIQTIEACNGDGVVFGFLDTKRILEHGVYIMRTPNWWPSEAISTALSFCYNQLGKSFDFPVDEGRVNTSIDSNSWYCTELINAAYNYYSPYFAIGGVSQGGWIYPRQWLYSLQLNHMIIDNMPAIIPIAKLSNGWRFRIYNESSNDIIIDYNYKMCTYYDGINWNNSLRHISNVTIDSYSNDYVDIQKNFMAGCCAFSIHSWKRDVAVINSLTDGFAIFEIHRNIK